MVLFRICMVSEKIMWFLREKTHQWSLKTLAIGMKSVFATKMLLALITMLFAAIAVRNGDKINLLRIFKQRKMSEISSWSIDYSWRVVKLLLSFLSWNPILSIVMWTENNIQRRIIHFFWRSSHFMHQIIFPKRTQIWNLNSNIIWCHWIDQPIHGNF